MRKLIEQIEHQTEGFAPKSAFSKDAMKKGVHPVAAKLAKRIDDLFDADLVDEFNEGVMAVWNVSVDDEAAMDRAMALAYRELWREVSRRLPGPIGDGLKPIPGAR